MTSHHFLTRFARAATGLLLVSAAGAALAHQASDAFLQLAVDGRTVDQRIDIALSDIDRDLVLDADGDGRLSWGEVRRRWADIERLADAGVHVTADGAACAVASSGPPMLEDHGDGRHAVVRRTLDCGAPVRVLAVDYRLFAATDPTHRGMVRLAGSGGAPAAVLVPGAGVQRFTVAADDARLGADTSGGTGADDRTGLAADARAFAGFVAEGMHHIAIGLDHILFLVTLLMVAVWRREGPGWAPLRQARSAWGETFRLVTAFTVAHSITLGLAAAGMLAPPSRWVESLIAFSVLLAALDNLRPFMPGPRWAMAAVFGLVHGFGFAGPLQDLGLQQGAIALPLLGFNLGVELGQLALVAVLLPIAIALRRAPWYRLGVVRGGSAAVAVLALTWTLERSLDWSLLP